VNIPLKSRLAEDVWIGHTILGDQLRWEHHPVPAAMRDGHVAQADLAKDSGIVRTAAQHDRLNVRVYSTVTRSGMIHR
jgi:hypothetical protein